MGDFFYALLQQEKVLVCRQSLCGEVLTIGVGLRILKTDLLGIGQLPAYDVFRVLAI